MGVDITLGRRKRLLLRKLPHHIGKFLPAEKVKRTQCLWNVNMHFTIQFTIFFVCDSIDSFSLPEIANPGVMCEIFEILSGFDFRILESYLISLTRQILRKMR